MRCFGRPVRLTTGTQTVRLRKAQQRRGIASRTSRRSGGTEREQTGGRALMRAGFHTGGR